jgi:Bacterial Ig-like domain (group 2).
VITNLSVGATEQLTSVSGATFTSKDTNIVTVDNTGLVEGIDTGTTKIVVSATGYNDIEVDVEVI